MAGFARLGDSIKGSAPEHSGHTDPPCGTVTITGYISGKCSSNVFINGKAAAMSGSTTTEYDSCCGTSHGSVKGSANNVYINGRLATLVGASVNAHAGIAKVTGGSSNVLG